MKHNLLIISILVVGLLPIGIYAHEDIDGLSTIYNFDLISEGQLPSEFKKISGDWEVKQSGAALSRPNLFIHKVISNDTINPVHFLDISGQIKDITHVTIQIRFYEPDKSGFAGFINQYSNDSNYKAFRINTVTHAIEYIYVKNDIEKNIANIPVKGLLSDWHRLTMEIKNDEFRILWDLEKVFSETVANEVFDDVVLLANSSSEVEYDDIVILQKEKPHSH